MLASLNNEEPGCIYSTDKPHEKGDNPLKTYEVSPLHALCMQQQGDNSFRLFYYFLLHLGRSRVRRLRRHKTWGFILQRQQK